MTSLSASRPGVTGTEDVLWMAGMMMEALGQPQRHPLAHSFRSRARALCTLFLSPHVAERGPRRVAPACHDSRTRSGAPRVPYPTRIRRALTPSGFCSRSFYFVEGSTDEDGHLTDVSGDDLACTDSFDTVEQVALLACCPPPACASRCPLTCLLSASSGTTTTTSSVPTSCPLTRIAASSGYARTHNARGPLPTCVASEGQHG